MDFWIFRFRKARETYSDLRNIVGNLDLWIMLYVQLGQRDLNRWHQYQTKGDHWWNRNWEPYRTKHGNQKKFSTKRIYMLPFAMRTKQNEKPKMENAFLKTYFHKQKKKIYIYIFFYSITDTQMEAWKQSVSGRGTPRKIWNRKRDILKTILSSRPA